MERFLRRFFPVPPPAEPSGAIQIWALPSEAQALVGKTVTVTLEEAPSPAKRLWDLRTYRLIIT